jgi:hypothetical protein
MIPIDSAQPVILERGKTMVTLQGKRTAIILMLASVLLIGSAHALYAKTVDPKKNVRAEKSDKKKTAPPFDVAGFRVGLTVSEAKKLLQKKKIANYETGFPDLFVYDPAPGAEVKLTFTCGATGYILGTIELSSVFRAEEAETALPKFKQQLVAKYGMPSITDSQLDRLEYCWGQCDQDASGLKLTARTTAT